MLNTSNKLNCFLDKENHCFVLELPDSGNLTIGQVFRSLNMRGGISWRQLADFVGVKRSSLIWQMAYKNRPSDTIEMLKQYLVIDEGKRVARFYDISHKPEGVAFPHVGPTIANGEPSGTTIYTKVPAKVTARMRITDPLQRMLTMVLKPTGGYLLGVHDNNLARPNTIYQVSGTAQTLNQILKTMHFVALEAGDGSIVVSVDDCQGDVASINSTTVSFTIVQSKEVSIPELNVPGDQSGTIGEDTLIDPITVSDEDNKLIELHVTPFGCYIHGFKNDPFVVGAPYPESKKMEVIYGRPEIINDFISKLYVRPTQEISYLGVELFCDRTRITKYIKIDATPVQPVMTKARTASAPKQAASTPKASTAPQAPAAPSAEPVSVPEAPVASAPAGKVEAKPSATAETSAPKADA